MLFLTILSSGDESYLMARGTRCHNSINSSQQIKPTLSPPFIFMSDYTIVLSIRKVTEERPCIIDELAEKFLVVSLGKVLPLHDVRLMYGSDPEKRCLVLQINTTQFEDNASRFIATEFIE